MFASQLADQIIPSVIQLSEEYLGNPELPLDELLDQEYFLNDVRLNNTRLLEVYAISLLSF